MAIYTSYKLSCKVDEYKKKLPLTQRMYVSSLTVNLMPFITPDVRSDEILSSGLLMSRNARNTQLFVGDIINNISS